MATVTFGNIMQNNLDNTYNDTVVSNVYKTSGRSVSVYTDTSASHEYLCTLIQNGHKFCKLLIKRPQREKCVGVGDNYLNF